MIGIHTVVLVLVALLAAPLTWLYIAVSQRSNAAHLELLRASDAGNKIDCSRWRRLERLQFFLGAQFVSMLAIIFTMRFIAGDSWSLVDNLSFWAVAISLCGFVIASEHYKLEDFLASAGFGRRVKIANFY